MSDKKKTFGFWKRDNQTKKAFKALTTASGIAIASSIGLKFLTGGVISGASQSI